MSHSSPAVPMDRTAVVARRGLGRVFPSLQNPYFRQLLIGNAGSSSAMSMSIVARGYLAYDLTHSALALGVVSLSQAIPQVAFSLVAGVVIDRVPKRRLLMVTQSLLAIQALVAALLVQFHLMEVWHLIALGVTQ